MDFAGLPNASQCDYVVFSHAFSTSAGGAGANKQLWEIPRNAGFLFIEVMGPGGGGGGGFSAGAGNNRGGGAGGGGGAVTRMLVPRLRLPDMLEIMVYAGGVGGGPGLPGTTPSACSVGFSNAIFNSAYGLLAFAAGGILGGAGTAAAGGVSGAATLYPTASASVSGLFGVFSAASGATGGAGGAPNVAGTNFAWGTIAPGSSMNAGAGGGGVSATDRAGGDITGQGYIPTLSGGAAGSNRGQDGYVLESHGTPWASVGASGGGSSNAGAGGSGGNGVGPGAGGGGGGGGNGGGSGGDGGPGRITIWWF